MEGTKGKLIDIPKETLADINVLAAMEDTDPKNYIQDWLIKHVKEQRKIKKLPPRK